MPAVQRKRDGAIGWAVQMAGEFIFDAHRFDKRRYVAGTWIVQVRNVRELVSSETFARRFDLLVAAPPPPRLRRAS